MHPTHKPKQTHLHPHPVHSHSSEQSSLKKSLILAFSMMLLEFVGGTLSHSLALVSDAAHMLTDVLSLALNYVAIKISLKPENFEKSFGYYRAEVLVALLNGSLLLGIALWIALEAWDRWKHPQTVVLTWMISIGGFGLLINLLSAYWLHAVKDKNMNLKGAFLHVLSDALSSVGVVLGALLIYFTGWFWIDSLLSLLISALIFYWAAKIVLDSIHVLMESTPKHISVEKMKKEILKQFSQVRGLHDIHVWEITSQMYALTAHLQVQDVQVSETMKTTEQISAFLSRQYHIEHVNFQYEVE
ncbi:MAG: cation transporter [Deltaproteobacteria bacterium]|nr:cation transporter [Deltaproteobacteria bacterium]